MGVGGCTSTVGGPWLRRIEITGNEHLLAGKILTHIALSESSSLPWRPREHFDPAVAELDHQRIEALYAAHGYFFARVTILATQSARDGSVLLEFVVEEGPATQIVGVEVQGLEALPQATARVALADLPIRTGQPFVHGDYLAAKGGIAARLRGVGYAFATVSGTAYVDRAAHTANIVLAVQPGPLAAWGEVTVQGADPAAILRHAAVRSGDRFDPLLLEATRDRLYGLGLFSAVHVDYVASPARPDLADVVITVKPTPPHELSLGGGLGIERDRQEAHLRALYTRRNFLGGLRTLRLSVSAAYVAFPNLFSSQRQGPAGTAMVALTQPDLGVPHLGLQGRVAYDVGIDYAFRFHGPRGELGLTYTLARERILLSLAYQIQRLQFFDTAPQFLEDPSSARRFFGFTDPYLLSYVAGTAIVDLRDRPMDPSRGLRLQLSIEGGSTLLGSGFDYQRIEPDGRLYFPLGGRLVVAAHLLYGRIFTEGASGSPITRRFYAGGPDSHRGFNYHRLAPQVPSSATAPIPVGGDRLLLAQLELRVLLVRWPRSSLGGALFCDAGDVPDVSIALRKLHVAVGAGLRYRTLIGTLRADLGIRLNRLEHPDPGARFAFHLSIGEAF